MEIEFNLVWKSYESIFWAAQIHFSCIYTKKKNSKTFENLCKIADVMHFGAFVYQIIYISDTFFLVVVYSVRFLNTHNVELSMCMSFG